jgi:DNA-binding NarL/FixJ family response regulator
MSTARSRPPWRVVVADDHPLMCEALEQLFAASPEFLVAATATTGQEALRQVVEQTPDLLILDVRLPDMGGAEAVRAVRATGSAARILLLTEVDDTVCAAVFAKMGVEGVVGKTAPGEQIFALARQICAGELPSSDAKVAVGEQAATLTEREQMVLALIGAGLRNREIAERLQITLKTVEFHVIKLKAKLAVDSRAAAMARAAAMGLAAPEDDAAPEH